MTNVTKLPRGASIPTLWKKYSSSKFVLTSEFSRSCARGEFSYPQSDDQYKNPFLRWLSENRSQEFWDRFAQGHPRPVKRIGRIKIYATTLIQETQQRAMEYKPLAQELQVVGDEKEASELKAYRLLVNTTLNEMVKHHITGRNSEQEMLEFLQLAEWYYKSV